MPPNVNPLYLTRWLIDRGISGFISGDSTAMRRNYHYTSGVIIFTHCYTPFAWRSDLEELEAGVRFAQTYILGRLRAQTFFSLAECNQAITLVMQRMNERTMRHLGLSRRDRRARRLPWAATESGGRVGWRAEPPLRAESGGYVDSAIFHPKSNGQYLLKSALSP